ncbi:hypothetical protein SARC_12336 [Sphaeroforma arctica JP610]|uniref:Armadillo repeat-containing domain-containing protein n=1 Tax=Sphaeroforma arctica JP610 TaxID=667725 RepID=A0A0L0FEG5_9EUKA|nr:hypothetical protein SARC_12336 [Sphaeroforma arctica JP610]KNC75130.1 hypothetical protein SARC_12336 [Sphaeroforma arctica JP610]|eukprot:XP_014149032.1 hypothetical protein SARC_12336 [Sphaeroforma arctica JP610]
MCRLLQYGGIEAACLLLKDSSPDTQAGASMALYHITRDPSERERLASKGVVEALYGVVRRRKADDLTMKHCLGGLCLCASTQSIAPRLVKNDHLRLLLDCVSDTSAFTTSRILAIRIVLALARQESVQEAIVMDKNGALKRLVQCLELPEEDLVVVTAQSLAFLSTGSEPIKTRIVQCDTALHSVLCRTAEKWSTSVSVLSNISCTIANLASVTSDSSRLLIPGTTAGVLCVIANTHEDSYEIQRHCGRGLGNLSVVPTNALRLLPYLGTTIVRMLHSSNVTVRSHALRVMDNLTVVTMATPTRQQVAELIKEDPQCQPIGTRLQLLVDQMGDNRTGRIATTIVERLQSIDTTTPHTAYGTNSATDTSHDTSSILDTAAEDQEWMRTP